MLVDCRVHLLPRRRLARLMKWMRGFYPEHPIPRTMTLEQCDAWRIVERHDHVWLEMTNVFSSFWDRRYVLKEYDTEKGLLLESVGPHSERIMFGTDHPAGSGTLVEIYQTTDRVGLAESVRERLIGGTAESFVRTSGPTSTRATRRSRSKRSRSRV